MHMTSILVLYGFRWHSDRAISNSSATRSIWLFRVPSKPISHSNEYHMHIFWHWQTTAWCDRELKMQHVYLHVGLLYILLKLYIVAEIAKNCIYNIFSLCIYLSIPYVITSPVHNWNCIRKICIWHCCPCGMVLYKHESPNLSASLWASAGFLAC